MTADVQCLISNKLGQDHLTSLIFSIRDNAMKSLQTLGHK